MLTWASCWNLASSWELVIADTRHTSDATTRTPGAWKRWWGAMVGGRARTGWRSQRGRSWRGWSGELFVPHRRGWWCKVRGHLEGDGGTLTRIYWGMRRRTVLRKTNWSHWRRQQQGGLGMHVTMMYDLYVTIKENRRLFWKLLTHLTRMDLMRPRWKTSDTEYLTIRPVALNKCCIKPRKETEYG